MVYTFAYDHEYDYERYSTPPPLPSSLSSPFMTQFERAIGFPKNRIARYSIGSRQNSPSTRKALRKRKSFCTLEMTLIFITELVEKSV